VSEPRSLKDAFNDVSPVLYKPSVLRTSNGVSSLYYDFAQRVMLHSIEGGYALTHFSQMDREILVAARDKLVELGGNPPELPAETPANPGMARQKGGLNP
jgi:hypothetical protein